jgi:hypothetical protein
VGYWYKEIACGSDGTFYCSEEFYANSVLRKSFDGFENNSANQLDEFEFQPAPSRYYDALGRRTAKQPEIRRPLFWKRNKKSAGYQGQSSFNDFSRIYPLEVDFDSIGFKVEPEDGTLHGYALAWHEFYVKFRLIEQSRLEELNFCTCRPGRSIPLMMEMQVNMTTVIREVVDHGDPVLAAHEKWHVEKYKSDGEFTLPSSAWVDYCDQPAVCRAIAAEAKSLFEPRLRALLGAQNAWDDEDPNNISKERIPVDSIINGMYREVDFELRDCINWVYEQDGEYKPVE